MKEVEALKQYVSAVCVCVSTLKERFACRECVQNAEKLLTRIQPNENLR